MQHDAMFHKLLFMMALAGALGISEWYARLKIQQSIARARATLGCCYRVRFDEAVEMYFTIVSPQITVRIFIMRIHIVMYTSETYFKH